MQIVNKSVQKKKKKIQILQIADSVIIFIMSQDGSNFVNSFSAAKLNPVPSFPPHFCLFLVRRK